MFTETLYCPGDLELPGNGDGSVSDGCKIMKWNVASNNKRMAAKC